MITSYQNPSLSFIHDFIISYNIHCNICKAYLPIPNFYEPITNNILYENNFIFNLNTLTIYNNPNPNTSALNYNPLHDIISRQCNCSQFEINLYLSLNPYFTIIYRSYSLKYNLLINYNSNNCILSLYNNNNKFICPDKPIVIPYIPEIKSSKDILTFINKIKQNYIFI